MKELTAVDFEALWPALRRWLPTNVTSLWMLGSASVTVLHPELPSLLRVTKDVDFIPIGTPVLYYDGMIMEREMGEESEFSEQHRFFVDYVGDHLLSCTPVGWQDRAVAIQVSERLTIHCLDPHDVAYNKLYAGRPKDIVWIRGLLGTGIITWDRLLELHASNPLADEDRAKVDASIAKVMAA